MVASRVLMNMELVEGENANRLWFFILGDSSSSSSSPSVNQRSKWRLLVCLKQQASTKIHFRTKIVREKTSHSEAEQKNKENTKAHHQALSHRGFTATKPYMQDSYARWLLKESTQLLSMCWHQENAMPRDLGSSRGPSDLQSDALPTELSWLCAKSPMLLTRIVHLGGWYYFGVPVDKVCWVLAAVALGD